MKCNIGIELGVKNIVVGVVEKNGKLLRKESIPAVKDRAFEDTVKDIFELIKKVLDDEAIELKSVKHIGIGCPGITDNENGIILRSYTLNLYNANIRAELQKYINISVHVENDANCVAVAEYLLGAAYGNSSSLTIKIGNGIGGGIIIDDNIYNGFNFGGTEFGHMTIDFHGRECKCGRKGCWETYASATALISETKKAALENPDSLILKFSNNDLAQINELTAYEAAKAGDPYAKRVFDEYLEVLSEGIANIVNILMPAIVVIAGPISKLGDFLANPLIALLNQKIYCRGLKLPEFKMAEMGTAGIVIGAAMLGAFKDEKLELI